MVDIPSTLGALFIGGFVAALFSGVVCSQAFAYFKNYPGDPPLLRVLAGVVWILDFLHIVWVVCALWDHLISHFGQGAQVDYIPWSLAMSIAFTATLTILVHLFLIHRIYKLSYGNLFISLPLVPLACARLCFACVTTAKMIQLRSLAHFVQLYTWSFTSGLALSSGLDVLITSLLCFLLYKNRKDHPSTNHILDKLTLYTFENGLLTCIVAFTSLICWITNKKNLVFMGLHFVISKFYANSFFATLNTRRLVHSGRGHRSMGSNGSGERNIPVAVYPADLGSWRNKNFVNVTRMEKHAPVHIQVDKTKTTTRESPSISGESPTPRTSDGDKEMA